MNDLRPQLAPGWSPVNIGLMILLFVIFKPLGLLMLAYILVGERFGLDLGHPETFTALWHRISSAWQSGGQTGGQAGERASEQASERVGSNAGGEADAGGRPAPAIDRARELDERARTLDAEREALAREREAFEREKRERA